MASQTLKSEKEFLRSQSHCGYPKIEKQAKKTLADIERREREMEEFNRKVKIQTITLQSKRIKNDFNRSKKRKK